MFTVEPERTIVALNEPFQPPAQLRNMESPKQLTYSGSVADHARLNALGEPRTSDYLTPPMPPLYAVFAGYVSRFVVVR